MKILILGGCGFVGRRFCHRLAIPGNEITVVDNMVAGQDPETWAFKPKAGKVLYHFQDCRDWFHGYNASTFDLVIHCAAIVGGRRLIDGDPLMVASNLSIDSEFFNWVVRAKNQFGISALSRKMPKVTYFSSSAVYPAELQTEKTNVKLAEALVNLGQPRFSIPEASYGFCKLVGEYLARMAAQKYNLDVAIYRPFGGYGEDQSLDYPLPSIVKRVVDREDPITIWGSGNQLRDFIYIEDVIDAVLATYTKLKPGEALNLGAGIGYSFFQLAELASEIEGYSGEITNDPSKPEGVFARVADATKLEQWYTPATSPYEGLGKVIEHYKQGLTLAKKIA